MDARIGTLSNGKFYAFANGYDQPETVGTIEQVEVALGLRSAPVARKVRRTFNVIGRPADGGRFTVYSDIYELQVEAVDHADAIKKANAAYRNEEGRHAVSVKWSAKVAAE